ncbi:MAG: hypothetical protein IRY96_01315 [Burkholderiales bacterium]|nr:hypothetical protein [Burkholderiales bacterium]
MQNDDTKKKQQERKDKAWERGNEMAPRRRRGPYGPIRSGRYAQRSPRNGS